MPKRHINALFGRRRRIKSAKVHDMTPKKRRAAPPLAYYAAGADARSAIAVLMPNVKVVFGTELVVPKLVFSESTRALNQKIDGVSDGKRLSAATNLKAK